VRGDKGQGPKGPQRIDTENPFTILSVSVSVSPSRSKRIDHASDNDNDSRRDDNESVIELG